MGAQQHCFRIIFWYLVCTSYFSVSDDASEYLRATSVNFTVCLSCSCLSAAAGASKKPVGNKVADSYSNPRAWRAGTLSTSMLLKEKSVTQLLSVTLSGVGRQMPS